MAGGRPKGLPKTGGRKKGTANKKSAEIANQAAAEGITPLEYMLQVLRDETVDASRRDDMAKAAAPYMHPRLASVEHGGKDGSPIVVKILNLPD